MSDITINVKAPSVNVNATPQSNVIAPKMQMIRGGSVTVDDELSLTSENPVQNKVVTAALNEKADIITDTASGSIASFPDGADGLPVKSLVCNIEPVQDLHGYDAPWPAGGGKNKLDQDDSLYLGKSVRTTYGANDTSVVPQLNKLTVGTYTLSFKIRVDALGVDQPTFTRYGLYLRAVSNEINLNVNGQVTLSSDPYVGQVITKSVTFTLSDDFVGKFEFCYVYTGRSSTSSDSDYVTFYDVQIEEGSTATTYAPYSNICPISGWTGANIYQEAVYDESATPKLSVSWESEAGTVYGGTLNVTTGVLTVDRAMVTIDGLAGRISKTGTNRFNIDNVISGYKRLVNYSSGICSLYKSFPQKTANANFDAEVINFGAGYDLSSNSETIRIKDQRYDSVDDFSAMLAIEKPTIVYELATPQTYQLTAEQVSGILSTLYGTNNIWADTGDVSVEYPADTKLYIQKLTQPTEDDMTANENIAANKFFMLGNTLYYSTAAIAAGATIIPGTNCNMVSLADALNQLNT